MNRRPAKQSLVWTPEQPWAAAGPFWNRRQWLAGSLALTGALLPDWVSAQAPAQQVRWLTPAPPEANWDPSLNWNSANINAERLMFNTLVQYALNSQADPTQPRMELARRVRLAGTYEAEINLRDRVLFHDGSLLNAEDVRASLAYYCRPDAVRQVFPGMLEFEVVDRLQLRISSRRMGLPMHAVMFLQVYCPILRAQDVRDPQRLRSLPNGTGPFRFVQMDRAGLLMQANPNFWGRKPAIGSVLYTGVPSSRQRFERLMDGKVHIAERLEPAQYSEVLDNEQLRGVAVESIETQMLHFRCNKPPFDDPRLRLAAAAAIDRSRVLALAGTGAYPADGPLPKAKFGHIALPDYGRFDPQRCQQLLAEAGHPNGRGLPEIEYIAGTGLYASTLEYCNAIADMLRQQGFVVRLRFFDTAEWSRLYFDPSQGHMIDGGWSHGGLDPNGYLQTLYHSSASPISALKDREMDRVIDKQLRAPTFFERRQIIHNEVLPMVAAKMPSLALFCTRMLYGVSRQLDGERIGVSGAIDFARAQLQPPVKAP